LIDTATFTSRSSVHRTKALDTPSELGDFDCDGMMVPLASPHLAEAATGNALDLLDTSQLAHRTGHGHGSCGRNEPNT
jgi:hypothetical protein